MAGLALATTVRTGGGIRAGDGGSGRQRSGRRTEPIAPTQHNPLARGGVNSLFTEGGNEGGREGARTASERRRWDSNPRYRKPVHRFSRPARTFRKSFRIKSYENLTAPWCPQWCPR